MDRLKREIKKTMKMNKYIFLWVIVVPFVINTELNGQTSDFEDLLVGKWKSYRDEVFVKEDSLSKLSGGNSKHQEVYIKLLPNGKGFDFSLEIDFEYSIHGQNLSLGNREYEIKKLTLTEMVIITVSKSTSIVRHRYYFKRVNEG